MGNTRRKICVVTGSRADYGLLRHTIAAIRSSYYLELQLLVTGSHLSSDFGLTVSEIEEDGHKDYRVARILSNGDDRLSMAKSIGLAVSVITEVLSELAPDIVLVLGDRFEILAACVSAYTLGFPVAHIHGGEVTGGALDEGYRHAITKLSGLHFVAAEDYRRRVIQMGESPERVFVVGAPGLETIHKTTFLDPRELSISLKFPIEVGNYFVIAYHPETSSPNLGVDNFKSLLEALQHFLPNFKVLLSKSNADAGGRTIGAIIDDYVSSRPTVASTFTSLGHLGFLSLIKHCAAFIGNSSSGIIEAPALRVPTINIGRRQEGRLLASSIVSVTSVKSKIHDAIHAALQPSPDKYKSMPYGSGENVSKAIAETLININISTIKTKIFHDLPRISDEY
jgi:GDP/UDP-N,N'-diacetylbacillosamine 2-epimerase (hydrolysing)